MYQTATNWMFSQLWEEPKDKMVWYAILEKAKEMEKEQIIDSFDEGKSDGYKTAREWDEMIVWLSAEEFYKQTYGTKTES